MPPKIPDGGVAPKPHTAHVEHTAPPAHKHPAASAPQGPPAPQVEAGPVSDDHLYASIRKEEVTCPKLFPEQRMKAMAQNYIDSLPAGQRAALLKSCQATEQNAKTIGDAALYFSQLNGEQMTALTGGLDHNHMGEFAKQMNQARMEMKQALASGDQALFNDALARMGGPMGAINLSGGLAAVMPGSQDAKLDERVRENAAKMQHFLHEAGPNGPNLLMAMGPIGAGGSWWTSQSAQKLAGHALKPVEEICKAELEAFNVGKSDALRQVLAANAEGDTVAVTRAVLPELAEAAGAGLTAAGESLEAPAPPQAKIGGAVIAMIAVPILTLAVKAYYSGSESTVVHNR